MKKQKQQISVVKSGNHYAEKLHDSHVVPIIDKHGAYTFPNHEKAPVVANEAVNALRNVADRKTIAQALHVLPGSLAMLLQRFNDDRPGRRR